MSITDILSIQLYTLRSLEDVDHILDTVADAGYRLVEAVGSHLDDARNVKAKLDARGLKACSSHVSLATLRERPDAVAEACKLLGFQDLFMPAPPPEQRDMPAEGWRALGKELGGMAESFAKKGIRLGYHNHHWEMAPRQGDKTGLDLIFEGAGASPLTWEADVAWIVRGNAEPKVLLSRHGSRLAAAHVKDIAPTGQNLDEDGWADVGAGTLDWRDLWKACRSAGAKWMVVEHDKPSDPARTAKASFAFLSRLGA
jgi:sugar phosphate isomerase/epimerase